jgi:Co/Zn/Cd efflux system component
MSAHCCHDGTERFEGASPRYRRILWIVIALNALMFGVEAAAGALAGSMALQADAMDFAADAATYGLTLYMLGKPDRWRASAALIKGASLALMGAYVLGATLWRVFVTGTPEPIVMGAVGFAALVVNATAALLLFRFREGDANIRSVWLCSRNDAIGNVAVMLAALGVFGTGTAWPDLAVAAIMAGLFLYSASSILRQTLGELRRANGGLGAETSR